MPIPSLDPSESTMVHAWWSSIASFVAALNITPEERSSRSEERSGSRPSAAARSSDSTIGRPKASPTMVTIVIRSASTIRHSSSASNVRDSRVESIPPWLSVARPGSPEVPCINGAAQSCRISDPASAMCRAVAATSAGVDGTGTPKGLKVASMVPRRLVWSHMTALGIPVVPPV